MYSLSHFLEIYSQYIRLIIKLCCQIDFITSIYNIELLTLDWIVGCRYITSGYVIEFD